MAKKKDKNQSGSSSSNDLIQQQLSANQQMFQLDLDERKRAADMQNAQFIAEQMRLRMEAEMMARGYLVQPMRDSMGNWTGEFTAMLDGAGKPIPTFNAAQQAREIALKEAEFELTKIRAERDYGLTYQDQQFRQAMESRQQNWTETYQRAQTMLAEGDLTGYYNGMATLDRQKWEADASGYMPNGQATLARQQAEWNAVLNAPRGPADWEAYVRRMRGIAGQGAAPSIVSSLMGGGPIAAQTGDMNASPRPATNTEMAMSLVYGNNQPRGYQPFGTPPMTTPATQMQGGWEGGQPPAPLPGGGYIAPPGWVPPGQGTPGTGTPPANPYPYPWQVPPPGGSWGATGTPSAPGQTGETLSQAIYGTGLQGVGSFDPNNVTQEALDGLMLNLRNQGSSVNDPRVMRVIDAARRQGMNTGVWDAWFREKPPHEVYGGYWPSTWGPQPGQPAPAPTEAVPSSTPEPTTGQPSSTYQGQNWAVDTSGAGFQEPQSSGYGNIFGNIFNEMGNSREQPSVDWSRMSPDYFAQMQERERTHPGTTLLSTSGSGRVAPGPSTTYEWRATNQQPTYGYTQPPAVDTSSTVRMFSNIFGQQGGQQSGGPYGGTSQGYTAPGSGASSPYGTGQAEPKYTGARTWSRQQFKKLSPTEQQFTLGWNAEENAETPEDAVWMMNQGAPNFRKGRLAEFAGIR